MKQFLNKTGVIILLLTLSAILSLSGCGQRLQTVQKVDTAMGTIISQTIYITSDVAVGQDRTEANISDEVISCIQELEKDYLSWRLETSEIYRINQTAGSNQEVELSVFLSAVLDRCQKVYGASDGAFDYSVGSLARLWNIDKWAVEQEDFVPPTQEQILHALQYVGGDKSGIDRSIAKLPKGMQLDLGAVGKGIALDEIRALLEQREEVMGGVISVGGSILTYGSKPDGGKWNVGIVNPMDTSENIGVLQLSGGWCVSTSGDYERFVEANGERYHHILNPHTGRPADSGVHSVTILTQRGLDSDALSTACFVLGVEKGMELAENFQAEALFILENGEVIMTEGMEQYFYLSNAGK